jgi:amino acid adenylation domain-containing protein
LDAGRYPAFAIVSEHLRQGESVTVLEPPAGPALVHHLLDRAARHHPRRTALRRDGTVWTYAELCRRSRQYAAWLHGRGVGRGDRVLIAAPHAAQTVAMLFAVSRLGAIYVIVGDEVPHRRLAELAADCEPRLVVDGSGDGRARCLAPRADVISLFALSGDLSMRGWRGDPADRPVPADPVSLIYTSGSTARPKAVVSTHGQVTFAARAIQSRLAYTPDDVVLCCLPLSFDYGLYQVFLACLGGSELVLGDESAAGPALLGTLREHAVTVLPAVPSLVTGLAMLLGSRPGAPLRLRMVTSSGAALGRDVPHRLRALVPGLGVVLMFGLTECKRVTIMEPNGDLARPGSAGTPLPGTEIFVVGEDGRRLPPGELGELVVRGPHVMAGYWRAPELTAARFRTDESGERLLYTGDLCRIDANGYLYFAGRTDDLYKQRGFRVSAAEVEAAALDILGVERAALLVPGAERPAVLLVSGAVTAAGVLAELALRIERYKLPAVCIVREELPLGPTGKVDKRVLRQATTGIFHRRTSIAEVAR